jgi:hypothetical protein
MVCDFFEFQLGFPSSKEDLNSGTGTSSVSSLVSIFAVVQYICGKIA